MASRLGCLLLWLHQTCYCRVDMEHMTRTFPAEPCSRSTATAITSHPLGSRSQGLPDHTQHPTSKPESGFLRCGTAKQMLVVVSLRVSSAVHSFPEVLSQPHLEKVLEEILPSWATWLLTRYLCCVATLLTASCSSR